MWRGMVWDKIISTQLPIVQFLHRTYFGCRQYQIKYGITMVAVVLHYISSPCVCVSMCSACAWLRIVGMLLSCKYVISPTDKRNRIVSIFLMQVLYVIYVIQLTGTCVRGK